MKRKPPHPKWQKIGTLSFNPDEIVSAVDVRARRIDAYVIAIEIVGTRKSFDALGPKLVREAMTMAIEKLP